MDTPMNIAMFFRAFRDISTAVHSGTDVKEVTGLAVKLVTNAVKARGAVLRILNLETDRLELNAACGLSDRYLSKGHVSSATSSLTFADKKRLLLSTISRQTPGFSTPKRLRRKVSG